MPIWLNRLLNSRKFWLAVLALIQSVVFALIPGFPTAVWQAIDGVLSVLIITIAAEDYAQISSKKPLE